MRVPSTVSQRTLEVFGAFLVYLLFTIYLTWPLLANLGSTVYLIPPAPPGPGDLAGSVAHLRELVEGWHNPFLPGRVPDFNAPDGLEIRWALNVASFPSTLLLYALAAVFGANAAYGLFVMLGYVASGLAMFLLVRRLTGSPWIGFIIGWAFAFYPFAVVKGEHPHFIHGWVFVVMAWRLLELMERPTRRNGVWAGAASVLALAWTQYFILLGGVCFAALTVGSLIVAGFRGDLRRALIAHLPSVGLVAVFGLVSRSLLLSTGEDATLPGNTLADIIATSAHVGMYLVPPAHGLLGDATVSYLNDHNWNAVEWTLYVGWTVLALALAGVVLAALRRVPPPLGATAFVALLVVAAGLIFSFPPQTEIGGHTVRLPSYLVFEVTTGWRLYTRFVIVVMLGLCLLAAIGLAAATRSLDRRARAALLAVVTVLVPLDLWNRGPETTYRLETPRIYSVLRAQPNGLVAEYPLRRIQQIGHYRDLYFQAAHDKPIVNGYLSGSGEQRAIALARLDDPATVGHLATLGVRYVLVTPLELVPGVPDPGRPGGGVQLIDRDEYGVLYRVTARPRPFVYSRSGLEPPEGPPGQEYRWASSPRVQLDVIAACEMCRGTVRFTAASLKRARLLTIADEQGRVLKQRLIQPGPTPVAVPLRFSRRTSLVLTTSPGPRSIQEETGAPDPRRVSIFLRNVRFEQSGQR